MTLLEDIAEATDRRDEGYFLGNIVLTPESPQRFFVIDGRQRLTTLFILICALRDLETDAERKFGLHSLVANGRKLTGQTGSAWRMAFPETELPFIEAVIAKPQRQRIDVKDAHFVTERLGAMLDVIDIYRTKLSLPPHESGLPRLEDLTDYLLNQCEVLVLTAKNPESGLRLFQVLNNRGLQLSEVDLVKPDLLHALPPEDQPKAARMWENMEDLLGSESFDTLLRSYIFIQSGDWVSPGQDFTKALKAIMMSRGAELFHFEDVPRYGDAFSQIHWGEIEYTDPHKNPNALMTGLSFLGRSLGEWKEYLPVAMELIIWFGDDHEKLFEYILALDRTYFIWFINETPENARRNFAFRMIMQMREGVDLLGPEGVLNAPAREQEKAFARLTEPFPKLYQRGAMIRRTEIAYCLRAGMPIPQYLNQTSSEHILPRNPRNGSQWLIDFSRRDMRDCLDLLGNGVPLSRDLDKRVGNKDFALKKSSYEQAGASRYFLTVGEICRQDHWKPDDIRARTAAIASLLIGFWTGADQQ